MDSAQLQKYNKMTTASVGRLVTEMAVPAIVSMLITSFYNLADTFFIGRINTQSTAAIGIVFSYMAVIQAVSFFFGHGSGNFISRALGHRDTDSAETMASVGFFTLLIVSSSIAILSFAFMRPLLRLFGSTETIMPYAVSYFQYIIIGTPFITSCFLFNNQMRFQGNALMSMIGIASGAVLNIALDPILIFVCDMGIAGAGLATAVSQMFSFVVMLYLSGKRGGIRIKISRFRPTMRYYREIVSGGLPSLLRQGFMCLSMMCLNNVASRYGDAMVAAFSVVNRVMMFAYAAMVGYGQGFQPVCGFNYGAGLYHRVRKAFVHSVAVATLYSIVVAFFGIFFAEPIVTAFRADDAEVIEYGSRVLRYQCFLFPLAGYVVMTNMYLQNIRKTWSAAVLSAARQGIFLIPMIFIGDYLWGMYGVMIAQPIADLASFILALPLGIIAIRKMMRQAAPILE